MKRLLFQVEGPTDVEFLEAFLPHIGIPLKRCRIRNYNGRCGLLEKFADALDDPEIRAAIVLADQDDLAKQDEYDCCEELKSAFKAKMACSHPQLRAVLIRIACHEREAWYLGDIAALEKAYPDTPKAIWKQLRNLQDPDAVPYPSEHLSGIRGFVHMDAARKMGNILGKKCGSGGYGGNRSASFRCFVKGVRDVNRAK